MRIDRDAFLIAVAALAGCERADRPPVPPPPAPVIPAPAPAVSIERPPAAPVIEHTIPPPAPVAPARPQTTKQWFHSLAAAVRADVTNACGIRASQGCQRLLRGDAATLEEIPEPASIARLPAARVAAYCKEDFTPPSCETPLVVAFAGEPVAFEPASPRAAFAFVPGQPAATDWPSAATPWIALDVDGDGAITSGAELFGSSTVLPGGARAANGFLALAPLDANDDGVLDARDPMFARLVLWTDRDGDRRSTPDELRPLASVVTAISLAATRDVRCTARDDCEGERATLRWRDDRGEHVGAVVDVYLPQHGRP